MSGKKLKQIRENVRGLSEADPRALQIAFTLLQWQEAKASVQLDGGTHVMEEGVSYDMSLVGNAKAYSKILHDREKEDCGR